MVLLPILATLLLTNGFAAPATNQQFGLSVHSDVPLALHKEVQGRVLASPVIVQSSDFVIATDSQNGGAYECCAAAGRANEKGEHRVVITAGQNLKLIQFLATAEGPKLDTFTISDLPKARNLWHGTDNNIVRTESGEFLIEYDSASARGFGERPPPWSRYEITFRAVVRPGMRGVVGFVESSDLGQHFAPSPPIDLSLLFQDKYDQPRPMANDGTIDVPFKKQGKNGDGTPKWWIGGEDRTEVYVCPFTGNLYVTTRVISGPATRGGAQQNTTIVMGSKDNGKRWDLLTTTPAWSPTVMTSTPDGRLWLMQETGSTNLLTYSAPTQRSHLPENFQAQNPSYNRVPTSGPDLVAMELKADHPSIARLKNDRTASSVLISYQVKNSAGNQEFRIVKASVDLAGNFTTSNVGAIRGADPKKQSAMYGAFIQPELVGEDRSLLTDVTLFYWLDAPRVGGKATYSARYACFKGGELTASGYLSTKDGKRRTWKDRRDPGDYMKGASFVERDGTVVFIPQWLEPGGMHGNLIVTR